MRISNLQSALLFFSFVALFGCNLPKPQQREDGNAAQSANFVITEAKGDSPFDNLGADFKVQKSRKFSFSACLKDSARQKEIAGHVFVIEDTEQKIRTDSKGCLNWSEEVPFNFFGQPQYLQWDRKISGTGAYRGTRDAHFAINPWNMVDRSPAVLNLETTSAKNLVKDPALIKKALQSNTAEAVNDETWFTIAPLEFKFIRVAKETTSDREIVFNTRACIKSAATTKNLRQYAIRVTSVSKTSELQPDNSGCVNWDDRLSFKYYDCQKHFTNTVHIESKDLAINQNIEIAINPWETFTNSFARDLRHVEDKSSIVTNCNKEQILDSQLLITNYNYNTLSYGYDIDNYLNLNFKKKLRFKADARVVSFSDMTKGRMEGAQKIRPGVYLLKLVLVKNKDYYNQKTFVASSETLVSSLDGEIRTDIELATSDLKGVGNRNTLLIELNPIKEDKVDVDKDGKVIPKISIANLDDLIDRSSNLKTRTYSGAMTLNLDHDSQELSVLEPKEIHQYLVSASTNSKNQEASLVREYINFGKRVQTEQRDLMIRHADIKDFAERNSLTHISLNAPNALENLIEPLSISAVKMSQEEIKFYLKTLVKTGILDAKLEQAFCSFWYKNILSDEIDPTYRNNVVINRAIMTCLSNARRNKSTFNVEKKLFVKEVGSSQFIKGYNQNLTVGHNVSLTNSSTSTLTKTRSINFGFGMTQKFAEIFSIGISGSYNISRSTAEQVANVNGTSITTNTGLLVQENIFELKLNRYQECSILKLDVKNFTSKFLPGLLKKELTPDQVAKIASKGLLLCSGSINETPITRHEHYYLLAQDISNTQMQDNGDARNRNFFIAVRGKNEFKRLLYFMNTNLSAQEQDNPKSLETLFSTGLPSIPGSFHDAQ